jgi:hypothetical protein
MVLPRCEVARWTTDIRSRGIRSSREGSTSGT